jgi:hypothetical protein
MPSLGASAYEIHPIRIIGADTASTEFDAF